MGPDPCLATVGLNCFVLGGSHGFIFISGLWRRDLAELAKLDLNLRSSWPTHSHPPNVEVTGMYIRLTLFPWILKLLGRRHWQNIHNKSLQFWNRMFGLPQECPYWSFLTQMGTVASG